MFKILQIPTFHSFQRPILRLSVSPFVCRLIVHEQESSLKRRGEVLWFSPNTSSWQGPMREGRDTERIFLGTRDFAMTLACTFLVDLVDVEILRGAPSAGLEIASRVRGFSDRSV